MKTLIVKINSVPYGVKSFLFKATLIFILWNVLYVLLLRPLQIPDQTITTVTTKAAVSFLNFCSSTDFIYRFSEDGPYIFSQNLPLVRVNHACNALELYVLFLSFIVCLPRQVKYMLTYALIGTATIFFLNVIRISGLAWLNFINSEWTEFNHKFLFKGVVYGAILILWFLYAEKKRYKIQ